MKTQNRFAITIVLMIASLLLALPAMASQVVYSNGPYNDIPDDGWTINFGYSVADSFYLGASTEVTGAIFYVWEFPGDSMTSVQWEIGTGSGVPIRGGVADATNSHGQGLLTDWSNPYGYSPDVITLTLPAFKLPPGTYWLTLSKAHVPSGDPVYWDENSGVGCTGWMGTKEGCPSKARENVVGTIPSESFEILEQ